MGGLSSPVGAPQQTRWKLGGNWVEATEIGWKLGGNYVEIGLKPQKVGIGSPRKMLNKRNPQYYNAKVEGCCRAWGALLGAIAMYKGWSFSTGCLGARNSLKGGARAKC